MSEGGGGIMDLFGPNARTVLREHRERAMAMRSLLQVEQDDEQEQDDDGQQQVEKLLEQVRRGGGPIYHLGLPPVLQRPSYMLNR